MASTIHDVARAAGVSVATVSRVFNDSGPVRESTRRSVEEAARRLQYTPNPAARSLSLRRTNAVGLLLPGLYGPFFPELVRGIDEVLQQRGYQLLITGSGDHQGDLPEALRSLRGRVDGLILMTPELSEQALLLGLPERLPLVLLNTCLKGRHWDTIGIDDYGGAYRMMSHLLALGHRRIAVFTGGARNCNSQERLRAWRDALAAHDVPLDEQLIFEGDFTEASGRAGMRRLLAAPALPDAVFALNDAMAIGALTVLREAGRRVPDDVAVVGFDDVPTARLVDPPLTTVRASITELGARAARRLLEIINADGTLPHRHEVLPAELVVRDSCGARVREPT